MWEFSEKFLHYFSIVSSLKIQQEPQPKLNGIVKLVSLCINKSDLREICPNKGNLIFIRLCNFTEHTGQIQFKEGFKNQKSIKLGHSFSSCEQRNIKLHFFVLKSNSFIPAYLLRQLFCSVASSDILSSLFTYCNLKHEIDISHYELVLIKYFL